MSAADIAFPVNEHSSLRRDLFVLSEPRCQQAKPAFSLAEDLCGLSEGLWSFTQCGCQVSELLCSQAMDLCMLAKDLCQVSGDLVERTTDLDQEAEDLVSLTTNLHQEAQDFVGLPKGPREEPTGLHQELNGVSSLAEDICRDSTVLVEGTTILFALNKGHSVFSKSGVSRSKGLSRVSPPLRLESEELFVEDVR